MQEKNVEIAEPVLKAKRIIKKLTGKYNAEINSCKFNIKAYKVGGSNKALIRIEQDKIKIYKEFIIDLGKCYIGCNKRN